MPRGRRAEDLTTLQMALVGYQIEKQKIDDKIREIQSRLRGKHMPAASAGAGGKKGRAKRVLSASARRRIAAAQRKRWAEHRRKMAQAAKQS